ncbi:MAG: SusC/RagA family TonB-linked outer membrane protein [Salinivirgaceae bacterium]
MKFLELKYLRIFLVGAFLSLTSVGFAQQQVTGLVEDMEGSPLPGVNVSIKGTTTGTITNPEGQYSIEVPNSDAVLVFSFIGYMKETTKVGAQKEINITLMPDIEALGEVLVIGYGTMKKDDKTGAVSQVTADELQGGVLTDAMQAIQGRSAGVMVTKKGGDPNSGFSIRIRGASGFDSNTQPLYVVDGVPGVDPTTVAPEDIKSFDILKDAASTAIYGSQGSNGVVLITTKKGEQSGAKGGKFVSNVQLNSKTSIDMVANRYDVLDADEIRAFAQRKANESGEPIDSIFRDGGANTNWQDEIFRLGVTTSNNLNFSGGNGNSSYYASVTHSEWEGVLKGTSKERTIGKVNILHKGLDDRLTISGTMSGTFEENDYENYNAYNKDDIIYQALTRNPTDPVYDDNGDYYQSNRVFNYENPLAVIDGIDNDRTAKRFLGNVKTDLEVFDGFVASANIAYTRDDNVSSYFRPANLYATADAGEARKSYNNTQKKLIELTGNYSTLLNEKHTLNVLGGYSWQGTDFDGFTAQGRSPSSDYLGYNDLGMLNDVTLRDVSSYRGASTLIGFFGRVQYDFSKKYYASASIRRDGSSKFGANNKWGWFPTAAVGWKLNEESFLTDVDWMDMLKLRVSYGVSGNQEIGEYRSLAAYGTTGTAINPETEEYVVVYNPAWNTNPDLKWEETREVNGGIDFAFFGSRLSGSLDVYEKITDDLLGEYRVAVPPNLAERTYANSGKLRNRGIELFAQFYAVDRPNFKWKTSVNVSHNRTILLDLGDYIEESVRKEGYLSGRGLIGDENYVTGIMEGEEIGAFYLPVYVTILDGSFVYKSKTGGFTDKLEDAERQIVGSPAPDVEIGWSNNIRFYNNWVVDFSFRAMIGNDVYNATEMFFDHPGNIPNLNGYESAIDWYDQDRQTPPSIADMYVEDASFLRLDYLSVGYEFNVEKIQWMQNLKVFVASNNLFVLTGYSGIDPETSVDGLAFGIDQYNVYPKTRTFTFGVNASF